MEKQNFLEGKKTDGLEATSASIPNPVENEEEIENQPNETVPQLNSSPSPTSEEVEDANVNVASENTASEEPIVTDENNISPIQGDQPIVNETVQPDPISNEAESVVAPEQQVHEENGVTESPALKTFTQSQVNDLVGNVRTETREKTFRYIYDRYGVLDEAGLDELMGNAQRYDSLNEQYEGDKKVWKESSAARDNELASIKEQVALMQSGIDSQRYEDAKFILKGKGLDVSIENIQSELATHPEWQKKDSTEKPNPNFAKTGDQPIAPQPTEPVSKISVLGNDKTPSNPTSEEDYVLNRMFKV